MSFPDPTKILLVEDEPAHVALIRRSFESNRQARLTVANSLQQARRIIEELQPDVILSDLRLPDGEGVELLHRDDRNECCPVVIMTSYGDEDVAVSVMKAGASDYIVKSEHALSGLPRAVDRVLREWQLILDGRQALEEQARLTAILEATPDLIATADADGCFTYMNQAGRALLGLTADEEILALRLDDFHSADDAELLWTEGIPRAIRDGVWRAEICLISRKKNNIHASQVLISHKNQAGRVEYFSTIVRDIRSAKAAAEKIKYLAYYDPLTALPNRNELIKRLEVEINRARRSNNHGALLFIDLDNFKNINDALGHPAGDKVLQQIAARLKTEVRGEDTVARLGGDEFVVILSGLSPDAFTAVHQAQEISEKLQDRINLNVTLNKLSLQLTASIGIAMFLDSCSDPHELLRIADAAMYHAKGNGKNTLQVFNEGMDAHFSRFLSIESELRQAILKQQFTLHFQPLIHIGSTQRLAGAEALIRWEHPDRGLILPDEFLDVLESSGLIIEVGAWVIEQSFQQLNQWLSRGIWRPEQKLSINISPRQFRDERFVERVMLLLKNTGVAGEYIDMEVTEHIVIHDVEVAIAKMKALSEVGITFSLDDFGTGYSSLSYLKRMPMSSMKIDRSFVRDITTNRSDQALVETILAMSEHLGMKAVAEGVETREQLDMLRLNRCDSFQGFYFDPPLPQEAFEQLLAAPSTPN